MIFLYLLTCLTTGVVAIEPRYFSKALTISSQVLLTDSVLPTDSSSNISQPTSGSCAPYWLENIKHQGLASFNSNSTYQIFRNVKDYGAKGDGLTDDTAAIQRAISDGNRCVPGLCQSTTRTPAVVYFPGGTYLISASIIDYYYTQVALLTQIIYGHVLRAVDHRQSELSAYPPSDLEF